MSKFKRLAIVTLSLLSAFSATSVSSQDIESLSLTENELAQVPIYIEIEEYGCEVIDFPVPEGEYINVNHDFAIKFLSEESLEFSSPGSSVTHYLSIGGTSHEVQLSSRSIRDFNVFYSIINPNVIRL